MNNHSKRYWRTAFVGVALLAGACGGGGDDGGGGAANKAEWEEEHASAVRVVSDDIDRAVQALNAGQRPVVLSECTQLQEDLTDARKAVPVPDATVDAALRSAFDATGTAAATCVEGGRVASDASIVEKAQREMKTARDRYSAAQDAIAAWK
jgi:hypothetical protein